MAAFRGGEDAPSTPRRFQFSFCELCALDKLRGRDGVHGRDGLRGSDGLRGRDGLRGGDGLCGGDGLRGGDGFLTRDEDAALDKLDLLGEIHGHEELRVLACDECKCCCVPDWK